VDRVEHARRMGWMCDRVVEAGGTGRAVQRSSSLQASSSGAAPPQRSPRHPENRSSVPSSKDAHTSPASVAHRAQTL
jgi:hypothetical protein